MTALPHRHGLRPGKPARAPLMSNSNGRRRPPGARASRPHAIPLRAAQFPCDAAPGHPAGGNAMGSAEAESWPRCRSTRVEEMGKALPVLCGRDARAPGWASSHDVVAAMEVHRSLVRLQQRSAVSSSNDLPGKAGAVLVSGNPRQPPHTRLSPNPQHCRRIGFFKGVHPIPATIRPLAAPSRSSADALVCLRGSSCSFVDKSFRFLRALRRSLEVQGPGLLLDGGEQLALLGFAGGVPVGVEESFMVTRPLYKPALSRGGVR